MTDRNTRPGGGGSGVGMAVLAGGLLVAIAVIAWFVFGRVITSSGPKQVDVDVNLPKMEAPKLPPVEPPSVPGPSTSN